MRAAIDIGGTFTDVVIHDETVGKLYTAKVHSTPADPSISFMKGLSQAANTIRQGLEQIQEIVHSTTLITNMLLEGKTAKVGLLITEGFRDLLEIGRQTRPDLYDLNVDRPSPIIPRDLIEEIYERVTASGKILVPLNEDDAQTKLERLKKHGIDSLAITLLFSFKNPSHEIRLESLARKILPHAMIFRSSQILPEFREYERASTTAIAAAVAPKVGNYLKKIESRLETSGWRHKGLSVMHSGGGVLSPHEAIARPHTLIESGPAAGLIASAHLTTELDLASAISFDMGGTTAKAGILVNGTPQYTTEYEVGGKLHHGGRVKGSGYPVRFPMIDLAEVGAGAGSIAWIDSGGRLKVGPQSAGADPGPACYGKGATTPTVTDAHLLLNHLTVDTFLGGEMRLNLRLAKEAVHNQIAVPLGLTVEEAAHGIIAIANSNMQRILHLVTVDRGYDPRKFILIAYGGAGPLHATDLAEEMDIQTILIPPLPGLFSSLGLLFADMSVNFLKTVMIQLSVKSVKKLNRGLSQLSKQAESFFRRMKVPLSERVIRFSSDLRYYGQNYELNVELPGEKISTSSLNQIRSRFDHTHERVYGYKAPEEPVQTVNLKAKAVWRVPKPEIRRLGTLDCVKKSRPEVQEVFFSQRWLRCAVYSRSTLQQGERIRGPAIIREKEATTLVGEDWYLQVDKMGSLILTRN